MAAMWPDALLKPARDRLFAEISDLRRCIRLAAGSVDIQPVPKRGHSYELDDAVVDVDIWRISRRLQDAAAATDRDAKVAALADAVEIHRGNVAEHADWDGLEAVCELVRRHGLLARMQLAELAAEGEPARAVELIDEAIAADPYNEAIARQAMRIQAAMHRPAAVAAHLERLRLALSEINAAPSEETVALARQLGEGTHRGDRSQ
jgi:DNA-binding SARP family transcriptional activator